MYERGLEKIALWLAQVTSKYRPGAQYRKPKENIKIK